MSAPRAAARERGPALGPEPGGSTQTSHRLLAYSDALLSIIATVMILPVAHTKIHPDQKLGESVQQLLLAKIAVYLMTFLIVTVAWAAHVRLFQVIEHIDDVLALLNLACMMIITFLPYTKLQKLIQQGPMKIDKIKDSKRYPNIKNFHSYDIMSTKTSQALCSGTSHSVIIMEAQYQSG